MKRLQGASLRRIVPTVAVSKDPRTLDVQASGDRLRIPGARAPSPTNPQSDVPGQEKPCQASGDRLLIPGVQAPGDESQKVPERLDEPFEEGLSGEPLPTHTVSWWNKL